MKLFDADGKLIHEGSLRSCAIGFTCDKIELEPRDIQAIIDMVEHNSRTTLLPILYQLKNRYRSEREAQRKLWSGEQ